MKFKPNIQNYLNSIEPERNQIMRELIGIINDNIPIGFESALSYKMPGWVVPKYRYPAGYHPSPALPLPFMSVASQKNHIGIYHMGIYADKILLVWFETEFKKHSPLKLNMGKSCIRFRKPEHVPLELIGELAGKMTVEQWIELYESNRRQQK